MKNWGLLPEDLRRLGNIFFVHFEGETRVEMTDMVTYYSDPHSVIINIYIFFYIFSGKWCDSRRYSVGEIKDVCTPSDIMLVEI